MIGHPGMDVVWAIGQTCGIRDEWDGKRDEESLLCRWSFTFYVFPRSSRECMQVGRRRITSGALGTPTLRNQEECSNQQERSQRRVSGTSSKPRMSRARRRPGGGVGQESSNANR